MNTIYFKLLAIIGIANSIVVDRDVFPFQANNVCAECLVGGNVYCVKAYDNTTIPKGQLGPESKCCKVNPDTGLVFGLGADDSHTDPCVDTVLTDPSWYCSDVYDSPAYALAALCPKRPDKCGEKHFYQFNRLSAMSTHNITGLLKGDSCTIELEGNCGAPSFVVNKAMSTIDHRKYGISFIEYNDFKYYLDFMNVPKTKVRGDRGTFVNWEPSVDTRDQETYQNGMPARQ